jgi:hypothetical protein
MGKKDPYKEWLKDDFGALINSVNLGELQQHFIRSRWLDQVLWMEGKAGQAQKRYYVLRTSTIIGGVIIPALVSLSVSGTAASVVRWLTFALSLLVAITSAVEGFFRYGERWRHYRRTVEMLKIEGWLFFQLSGPYRRFLKHDEAYRTFANRVEVIIQSDVETYITMIVQEKEPEKEDKAGNGKEAKEVK